MSKINCKNTFTNLFIANKHRIMKIFSIKLWMWVEDMWGREESLNNSYVPAPAQQHWSCLAPACGMSPSCSSPVTLYWCSSRFAKLPWNILQYMSVCWSLLILFHSFQVPVIQYIMSLSWSRLSYVMCDVVMPAHIHMWVPPNIRHITIMTRVFLLTSLLIKFLLCQKMEVIEGKLGVNNVDNTSRCCVCGSRYLMFYVLDDTRNYGQDEIIQEQVEKEPFR